jgi:hypothetical protein
MNKNIKAGGDIHTGDGGYSEGTQEEYENFVKIRNQSLLKTRLRKFEKDSGLDIYSLGAKRDMWDSRLTKFAELIVQDCAGVCDLYAMPDGTSETAVILSLAIRHRYSAKEE